MASHAGVVRRSASRGDRAPAVAWSVLAERLAIDGDLQARGLLGAMVALYVAVFGFLSWRSQSQYFTYGFDIGIHDQAIWLAAHGKPMFDTVRGLSYFGENVNLVSLALVPFYWLGAGPHFLIVVNTLALARGAIP